jgi:hypoxanthine phosphoribosyltransferase
MIPSRQDLVLLHSPEAIREKVEELGAAISGEYEETDLVVVCVLRGATIFFSDLVRQIRIPCRCDFVQASSYGSETVSSGKVEMVLDLREDVRGRHVLLVEDIVDTGRTARAMLDLIGERGPASVVLCTLLDKKERREVEVPIRWRGFEVPDRFLVGYGLDVDGMYRNLPGIWMI